MNKLIDILNFSTEYLTKKNISNPRLNAEKIISEVLGLDRIMLYVHFERPINTQEKEKIKSFLKKISMDNHSKNLEKKETLNSEIFLNTQSNKKFKEQNSFIFNESIEYLKKYDIKNAKLEVELIFSHILKINRMLLSLNFNKKISKENLDKIKILLKKRAKEKIPIQYLLGFEEFYGYKFIVNKNVLIPRPETELLVEECINLLKDITEPKILDIGCGSGAISITLAKELPNSKVIGIDISKEALIVAEENCILNNCENLKFIKSNIFENIKYKSFDLIVSNPPYIPNYEYKELQPEVKLHEPKLALVAENNGYYFYDKISSEARTHLKNGGLLAFEMGYNQSEKIKSFLKRDKYKNIKIKNDYNNIPRMIFAKKGEI
ncbi:release factor glutamine methyltransferase [Hypnocyclicus thermotrophus]|uniref:Release factor glutamine methyltransferase n=1 Tax=Hypnocyclicus thermotrophus TaxID=1627895 RepID=A0AA46DXD0_9FUSO|nr:peptide chain release factor N(5)-glutamine methyltransferase [Hypnocyclicus thermotrophus]TDT68047.1 release factor glutamine methyltransferase [Hypnocyclicus thermotrophus]